MTRRRYRAMLSVMSVLAAAACRDQASKFDGRDGVRAAVAPGNVDAGALITLGESLYQREAFDSARATYELAVKRAIVDRDIARQAGALRRLGLSSWRLDDYPKAQEFLERAIALDLEAGLDDELPKSYNALGLLAHNRGRFAEARNAFLHAEAAARQVGDSGTAARALGNLGMVYSDIGDFDAARRSIEALRRWGHDRPEPRLEANALVNLGMVEIRVGNPRGALRLLTDARQKYRVNTYAIGEENALGQLGTAYQAMGQPQLALAYLDSALTIARREDMGQQETDDLQLMADIFAEGGDQTRALEYLAGAAILADSLGVRKIQGDIARSRARAMYTLGNLVPAIEQVRAARRFHADAGALLEELEDVLLEGEYAMRSGDRAGSTAAIARARAIAAKVGSRVARVELALGEARVAELVNDPAAVLRATSRVRDDLRTATTGRAWEAPALAARAHAAMRHWAEAVASGRDAVREIERVRANFVSGSLRASFTSDRANVYGDLVLALLALGRTDEALAVADAARSRALLEHLAAAGTNVRRGVATEMAEADRLLRRIGQLTEHLRMADTATPRRRGRVADNEAGYLSGELVRVRREYETLLQRTTVGDRRAAILMGADTPDTKAIQAALGPQEAVLEYLVLADRLITFVIRPLDVHALSQMLDVSVLSLKVRLARDLVGTRNIRSAERDPILRALHGVLIAPAARAHLLDGVSRLIIVPHAALTYLPFAALIDPATSQYVIDQYDLLTLPSGASLVAVRGGDRGAANAFVSVNVFAPLPDGLPGTLAESKALQHIDRGARTHVGSEATERALRASLGDSFPVHVATHGVLNARNPMFSHLELTHPDIAPVLPEDDGRLEVHELLDLTIRSPLVFLSGCETGKGMSWSTSFTRGEDYATLSEAFLFAGARNVVSTLWRIEDTSAAEFAKAFYSALPNGDPVTALARAQRGMRADRAYASPYYWAAYVVSGAGIGGSAKGGRRLSVK